MGMESPKNAFKGSSFLPCRIAVGSFIEPTERWVFCCWPTKKPEEEGALQAFLSTKPQAQPERKRTGENSRRDLTLLIEPAADVAWVCGIDAMRTRRSDIC